MPKRKHLLLLMTICFMATYPVVVQAQSRSQGTAKYRKFFGKFDANGNGTFDVDEWAATPKIFRDLARYAGLDSRRSIGMDAMVITLARRADRTLQALDRNRDGSLDGEEFKRSQTTRRMFEAGGADITKTYARDKFIEVYLRLLAGDDLSRKRRTREKTKLTLDLPETYRKHDRDEDNQVGLYEWPRSQYAEFFLLDRNGDGFLTPRELHQAEEEKALLEKATAPKPATRTAPTVRIIRSR